MIIHHKNYVDTSADTHATRLWRGLVRHVAYWTCRACEVQDFRPTNAIKSYAASGSGQIGPESRQQLVLAGSICLDGRQKAVLARRIGLDADQDVVLAGCLDGWPSEVVLARKIGLKVANRWF